MPPDQNPQSGRRQHFHRGRRGPDRRGGGDRRPQHPGHERPTTDQVDIEQIMRDIRAQISQRHGIELSNQQIQELAARRLEAILDPRTVKPALLDQLRRSAGLPVEPPTTAAEPAAALDSSMLYASSNGLVRFFRRLLNPFLRLLFDPAPLVQALNDHARQQREALRRETERDRRQAEWNALHFAIVQRLVTEVSRASIETQSLTMRVESLAAKVDFNERRVRGLETVSHPSTAAPSPRAVEAVAPQTPAAPAAESSAAPAAPTEGSRRRRRRRRGRRGAGGVPQGEAAATTGSVGGPALEAAQSADDLLDDDIAEGPDLIEDEGPVSEMASPASEVTSPDQSFAPEEVWHQEPPSQVAPQPPESIASPPTGDEAGFGASRAPQPSPAPDEPFPQQPGDPVDPGPTDR